jgi:hypothetical protein
LALSIGVLAFLVTVCSVAGARRRGRHGKTIMAAYLVGPRDEQPTTRPWPTPRTTLDVLGVLSPRPCGSPPRSCTGGCDWVCYLLVTLVCVYRMHQGTPTRPRPQSS